MPRRAGPESDGFELDIELACKLARNGNSPMEVPVNYVARGFDEGKKIRSGATRSRLTRPSSSIGSAKGGRDA